MKHGKFSALPVYVVVAGGCGSFAGVAVRKGHYIRTHNGRSPQLATLEEFEHGPGRVLVQSNRCKDGSFNDHYNCGCVINRPARSNEPRASSPRPRTTTKRSKRDWLEELLADMEE